MINELRRLLARLAHWGGTVSGSALHPIAVVNQKGGCAKTTTAINLAGFLAREGFRVLLIDSDPQAHASLGLGYSADGGSLSLHEVLSCGTSLEAAIHPTAVPGLDLVPAHPALTGAPVELASALGRESILRIALKKLALQQRYTFVLFDCSPSLNVVTLNALAVARHVLVPVQPSYYALEGMRELFQTVERVKDRLNPELELLGILVTLFSSRLALQQELLTQLRDYFGAQLFSTPIPLDGALAEAPLHHQPIHVYAPESFGALAYQQLAREVIARTLAGRVPTALASV
jgi:chromosome partitioning protein